MKNTAIKLCIGLTLAISTTTQANWGNSAGLMPFGGGQGLSQQMQPFGGSMPWGGSNYNQSRYQPRYNPYNRGGRYNRGYQAPQSQPFGGLGLDMLPFGGMSQPQQQYRQPQSSSFMIPGMDQGIRTMMEPGKIMAEEATPGVYMKPTWR